MAQQYFLCILSKSDFYFPLGVKIDMTAPVLTKVIHGQGPNCRSTFVQHFMLTHKLWAAPIPPTDASVYIVDIPQMDVFVRWVGEWIRLWVRVRVSLTLHIDTAATIPPTDASVYIVDTPQMDVFVRE